MDQNDLENHTHAQAFLGILMLDTQFPRIIGDAGNIESYPYPARTIVVDGADSVEIVQDGLPTDELIEKFCIAAKRLEASGAKAIISTCGFLISVQDIISKSVNIPVMVSALSLYSQIVKEDSESPIAIITASEQSLGDNAFNAAGINRTNVYISGMEDCEAFRNAFLQTKNKQSLVLNEKLIREAVIDKSLSLLESNPHIRAFLLECGNLPPYAKAIEDATGKPVYSILNAANQMMK